MIVVHRSTLSGLFAGIFAVAAVAACSGADEGVDPEQAENDVIAARPGTVENAAATACTTLSVRGLAKQLIDEINCAKPNLLTSLDGVEGIELDDETFPFVQTSLVEPLKDAAKAAKTKIKVNSALRTLPQQVLLSRWAARKRCGVTLAAKPGGSNHESGLAVDIANHGAMKATLTKRASCASKSSPERACFQWMGPRDPVHFDYKGDGTVELEGESIRAFQRLWNRNNPTDKIAESGAYDKDTEARAKASPVAGFERGAECAGAPPAASTDQTANAAQLPTPGADAGSPAATP